MQVAIMRTISFFPFYSSGCYYHHKKGGIKISSTKGEGRNVVTFIMRNRSLCKKTLDKEERKRVSCTRRGERKVRETYTHTHTQREREREREKESGEEGYMQFAK
jgi:hypothetical protein